jgi:hypothetical protein
LSTIRAAALIGAFWLIIGRSASAEPPCLRIGIDPGALGAKATATVVKALYDQAGLCVTIQEIPNRRIATMIRAHELDGEGARIGDYIAGSPDLLPIPTPLVAVIGKLYWLKGQGRPEGSGHTVGFIRGYIWPPLAAQTLDLSTTEVADQNSLAKMAATGRLDGFFMTDNGYIRVVQDIRGKYGSEGDYVMNRPLHGPLNPTPVDQSTDTYDTIDWLVKHVPESNGKVGVLGISYDGYLALMPWCIRIRR